ncbi:zinc finger protein 695-like [Leptidea sinapis]|uniref:zinc finger protein 695-like n=1 Tax=Leptidea sinapis TaxID=189913 RepID=UPI0021C2ACA9|nr:zinc finger protein 695-like [Leptidea sinapis]
MASKTVRKVNVIPLPKIIKKETFSDDEEDTVQCKLCSKGFVTQIALNNHAKIEHIEEYLNGEDLCVHLFKKQVRRKLTDEEKKEIQLKTEKLLSSMKPVRLSALASAEASYMIIKDEDAVRAVEEQEVRSAPKKRMRVEKERKEKEPKAITGPFECLQPSTLNPSGKCHQMFFSCCDYSTHFREEHTRRRKGFKCQVCEKPLSGDLPFTCSKCGAAFVSGEQLAAHAGGPQCAAARGGKQYACGECGKRFAQAGGLQQHARCHTGERPYRCTHCDKAFTQKSGLEQHLRIHTKSRPYRCVVCEKTFCQSVHLTQHMRTHTNVMPFQCAVCQKRFKQSSHLNYHLRYHSPQMTDQQQNEPEVTILLPEGAVEPDVTIEQPEEVQEVDAQDLVAEEVEEVEVADLSEFIDEDGAVLHEAVMVMVETNDA